MYDGQGSITVANIVTKPEFDFIFTVAEQVAGQPDEGSESISQLPIRYQRQSSPVGQEGHWEGYRRSRAGTAPNVRSQQGELSAAADEHPFDWDNSGGVGGVGALGCTCARRDL